MKILFIVRHYSYLRLFESAIDGLAARGHELTLAANREETMGGRGMVERLAARYPNIRVTDAPVRSTGAWAEVGRWIRVSLDYLRYVDSRYDAAPHLRARAEQRTSRVVVAIAQVAALRQLLRGTLAWLERSLPLAPALLEFLRTEAPDLILITPLVEIGSPQLDYLAAARHLGLRVALPVGSWDHLSSKALLRHVPDRLLVWNPVQQREAIEFHGIAAERVIVTGAQAFDQWFDRVPTRAYPDFCRRVGLRADKPFVLYVCSSLFRGTAHEPSFVDAWIRALRASDDPRLQDLGILVRPHPARLKEWASVDLSSYRNVVSWGAHPVDEDAKDDYFESMYYSAAVVGLNTSAFIEAAVVGKPVHTVLLPEISGANQEGTLHFHYLTEVNGGLLYTSRSLDEHLRLLADSLAPAGGGNPRAERFVEGFVRPFGRREAATPRFVQAIEEIGALPPQPPTRAASAGLGYAVLFCVAAATVIRARSEPWRKQTKHRLRKWYERRRALFFRAVKEFVVERMTPYKRPKEQAVSEPSALTPKVGTTRDPAKTLAGTELPDARAVRELVTALGRSGRPVIAGPWLSETGFELLYWIPFLAWARAYGNLDSDRLIVVSRGGAASWYGHITPHYEEIFSLYSPDEFRMRNEQRIREQQGRLKHVEVSSFDREMLDRIRQRRQLGDAEILHPSSMYQLFDHFWHQRAPMSLVEAFTVFTRLEHRPGDPELMRHLPREYVAAKFYGNTALPDTPENRAFATSFLSDLAEQIDVVLLNTNDRYDDHGDFPPSLRGRLHSVAHLMTPENNLHVQTQIIQGAKAFVGTYGGFSYLAPLCGVNTMAFYSHASGFRFDHLEVAKRVFSGLRAGAFVEMDVRAVETMRLGFGGSHMVSGLSRTR